MQTGMGASATRRALDWVLPQHPDRVIAAGFWSAVLLFLWPWESGPAVGGILPLVVASIAVQAVSPWTPPAPAVQPKKLRLRGL